MALVLTACGSSASNATKPPASGATTAIGNTASVPADIKKAGAFNLCADLTYPPMTFTQNNKPAGFDVDLASALAKMMGVQAEFHQTGFPDIIAALQGGKCDAIMNGINGTPDRAKQIALIPYLEDGHGFAVQKANPKHLTTLDDLSGKNVATQLGSSDQQYLEQLNQTFKKDGKSAINIVTFPQDPAAFAALQTGRVDAFFQDLVVLGYYAKQYTSSVSIANVSANQQTIVIGVRKNDTDLISTLKSDVAQLYKNGTVSQIAQKWGIQNVNLLKNVS